MIRSMRYKGVDVTNTGSAAVTDIDNLRETAATFARMVRPIVALARYSERCYRAAHPETIKATDASRAARHRRRYQRMMARKGA